MKKYIALLIAFTGLINATEKVTMHCELEAMAEGYEDKSYEVKMLLNVNYNNSTSILYNSNGGLDADSMGIEGTRIGKWRCVDCTNIKIYDGVEYQVLSSRNWNVGEVKQFSLNIGDVACAMTKGWKK